MRKFNVNVNGKTYSVEVEEVTDGAISTMPMTQQVAVAPVPKSAPTPAPAAPANGVTVKSPMPGLVLSLAVENGARVKKGDKILVLEAMKMENDITATADGEITFTVKKGDNVESDAAIAVIA